MSRYTLVVCGTRQCLGPWGGCREKNFYRLILPPDMAARAYQDSPLPIAAGQTISQPYIVAFMVEALALQPTDRVLEIGAGSGYAAAVMGEIVRNVYTVERIEQLAVLAAEHLADAGYRNVHVRHADGTLGWQEHAPFNAILVSAGGPEVPESLKAQLAVGGRLVIPIGRNPTTQELVRITRRGDGTFDREDLADVRFVPLIGAEGWELEAPEPEAKSGRLIQARPTTSADLPSQIRSAGTAFNSIDDLPVSRILEKIGNARIVLIGEASHGTSEFYRARVALTQRLIEEHGFYIVAAEADWPDAARINHYVRHWEAPPTEWSAFSRFPTWMWRNRETREFVDWLHQHNHNRSLQSQTGFYGLDLYSLYTSVRAVLGYLEDMDPDLAATARTRYGCLSPWESDPAAYGHAALTGRYRACEPDGAR